jgi:dTDP-glucose 4,6-dehydratase
MAASLRTSFAKQARARETGIPRFIGALDMILVTGGAGFIGSNFVRMALADRTGPGERVINLDKLTYAGNLESLAGLGADDGHLFVKGDIGDRALVVALLREHRPRAVINFAAETHVDRSINGAGMFVQANVVGLFELLEAVRTYWSELPETGDGPTRAGFRFLQVSTDEVYGSLEPGGRPFAETDPHRPNSPYSATKAAGDHFARAWHQTYGLPTLTTNGSNVYGPCQFPEKLIPLTILNALEGKPLPLYGDGCQVRDWLYIQDHCRATLDVLARGRVGEVYNVGGNSERMNLTVVEALCGLLDRLRPRSGGGSYLDQIDFVADRPGHDRRYAIDGGKIRHELGWQPAETLDSGLEKTVRWYLDNPDWVEHVQSGRYRVAANPIWS